MSVDETVGIPIAEETAAFTNRFGSRYTGGFSKPLVDESVLSSVIARLSRWESTDPRR